MGDTIQLLVFSHTGGVLIGGVFSGDKAVSIAVVCRHRNRLVGSGAAQSYVALPASYFPGWKSQAWQQTHPAARQRSSIKCMSE